MINWSNYFDRIYCLHYIEYTKRKQLLQFELNRVGILNSGIFEYYHTYNGGLERSLYAYIKNHDNFKTFNIIEVILGHYHIIRDAYTKGYKNILIIEDDIRFLKDLNKIKQILQNKPQDSNIILYDKFVEDYNTVKQFKKINNYYSTFTNCYSAGCYELDRIGMQKLLYLIENIRLRNPDWYFFRSFTYLKDLNFYCCNPNICVQALFKYRQSDLIEDTIIQKGYKFLNINFDNYMMRIDGSPYYYGDYIDEQIEQLIATNQQKSQKIKIKQPIIPIQMDICLLVSYDQIDKLLLLIYTLQKYSQSKFNIYIGIDRQPKEQYYEIFKPIISQKVNINIFNCIQKLQLDPDYEIKRNWVPLTFTKCLIPKLFPNLDKILYLDYDIIINKKGIEWLYNIDLKNNYLAAAEDLQNLKKPLDYTRRQNFETKFYFNSGVVLFNLKKIREDKKDQELVSLLKHRVNNLGLTVDQSIFNYTFKENVLQLNMIFNNNIILYYDYLDDITCLNYFKQKFKLSKLDFLKNTIVVHFAHSILKPWNTNSKDIEDYKVKKQYYSYYNIILKEMMEKINEHYLV